MNKKVYISGPISGYDIDERKKVFHNAEKLILSKGYTPVNPLKNGLSKKDIYEDQMKVDIKKLIDCDYIYLLPKWYQSKGATLEFDIADSCGIEILII